MDQPAVVWTVGTVADLGSTEIALGRPGREEWNPLIQTRSARFAVGAATTAVGIWGDRKLQRSGRRGLARWLRFSVLGAKLFIASRNLR